MDGLFLNQEKGDSIGVIIPCSPAAEEPLDAAARKRLSDASTVLVFHKDSDRKINPSGQTVDIRYGHPSELPDLCAPFLKG